MLGKLVLIIMLLMSSQAALAQYLEFRPTTNGTSFCSDGSNPELGKYCKCREGFYEDGEYCRQVLSNTIGPSERCDPGYKEMPIIDSTGEEVKKCVYNMPLDVTPITMVLTRPSSRDDPDCRTYSTGQNAPDTDDYECACPDGYELDENDQSKCKKYFERSIFGCDNPSDYGLEHCPCPTGFLPSVPAGDKCKKEDSSQAITQYYNCRVQTQLSGGTGEQTTRFQIVRNGVTLTDADNLQEIRIKQARLLRDGFCQTISDSTDASFPIDTPRGFQDPNALPDGLRPRDRYTGGNRVIPK